MKFCSLPVWRIRFLRLFTGSAEVFEHLDYVSDSAGDNDAHEKEIAKKCEQKDTLPQENPIHGVSS